MTTSAQIEASIAVLESQRAILGDAVVDASIGALRARLDADEPARVARGPAAERKLVTILFADIAGFTALSEQSDPEQVRSLVNACFSRLVPIIEGYGGVVEKFIGDEIMALFGAPVAHDDDVERALRAALDMRHALLAFNTERGSGVSMRFGVNTGTVVAGGLGAEGRQQYGVMGDTVNVAARIVALAEVGEILVGAMTRRLADARFAFDTCTPTRVKGKAEPIPVFRLRGLDDAARATRGITGLRSPMLGRAVELATIVDAVNALPGNGGGAICVLGDAGLGKSRLVAEARAVAGAEADWFEGRALSYAEGVGYHVARDLIDHLVGVADDATPAEVAATLRAFVAAHLGSQATQTWPYLARLRDVPLDARAEASLKDLLPQALQARMQDAFVDLIAAVARTRPLVLAWEDLHWIDHSSLGLLGHLLTAVAALPVLLLLSFRPNDGRIWAWHRARPHDARYRVVALAPLSPSDSDRLITHLLKIDDMPARTRQLILDKSEGNPFFVEELLRSLIDQDMVRREDGRFVATRAIESLQVPDTLHGTIAARIDRLAPDDKYTLQTASVIGRLFQRPVLGRIVERHDAHVSLDTTLGELQRRELVHQRNEFDYLFKHAVTHEVAYHSLLIARRKELHLDAALAIEALWPEQRVELAPTLAFHYAAADAHAPAMRCFVSAGDRAQQTWANEEAIAFYRAAIRHCESLDDRRVRATLHESLGMVLGLIGEVEAAIEAYGVALGDLDPADNVTRARLLRRHGNAYNVQRRTDDMLAVYAQAMDALGGFDDAWCEEWIELQLDRIWACYFAARPVDLAVLLDLSRDAIERHGTLTQKARWFGSLAMADFQRYRYYRLPDETLLNARRQVEAAQAAGNRRLFGRAQTILGFVHMWRDELDDAERFLLAGLNDVEAVGDVDTLFINCNYLSLVGRKRGDVALTRRWAERTLALAEKSANAFYRNTALGSLAWVAWREGAVDRARELLDVALADVGTMTSPIRFFVLGPALAVAVRDGRWADATAHATMLLHVSQQQMPPDIEASLHAGVSARGAAAGPFFQQALAAMHADHLGYV